MAADPATIRYYEQAAPHYTFGTGQAPSRHLDGFLDRLDAGAHVLELGCGGGRDAARIVERGFRLDATDGTPAMVHKANERFGVGARMMRFDQIKAIQAYDAVWAHACLLHVPRAQLPGVLHAIHRALRDDGLHFANYKLGEAEGRDRLGRLTNLPGQDWLVQTYLNAGFAMIDTERYRGKGADGTRRDWCALTVQRMA